MYEFIKTYQYSIMLAVASISFAVGLFVLITRSLSRGRKLAIMDLSFSSAILLFFDRLAYIYHGVPGNTGYWMVRVSNFLVFFMTVSVVHAFNLYLTDLSKNEMGFESTPFRLRVVEGVCGIGWFFVIISQFNGMYYTFDADNAYQRGPLFIMCFVIPYIATLIQLSLIIQYGKKLSGYIRIPLFLFAVLPMVAGVFQAKYYGVSLVNITLTLMGIVIYAFVVIETNHKMERMQKEQVEDARNMSRSVVESFEQIIAAIASAVDSRDMYSRGHSLRVADYSREIAGTLGMDEQKCTEVYYSAILHDVGKIVTPSKIIENMGHLTDAEKKTLRNHTINGGEILSKVEKFPFLKTAALYHHERYDGMGYPEGRQGKDIPLIARIVAVADAYDEMTSSKYSHQPFAQTKVRELLLSESGKKYDPEIVRIMVDMIDRDVEYVMRESDDADVEELNKNDITSVKRMHFDEYKGRISDGVRISGDYMKLSFETRPDAGYERKLSMPALILFDSFDRCVHRSERGIKNLHYFEFGEIWLDGHVITTAARDIRTEITTKDSLDNIDPEEWIAYDIEAVTSKDHVQLKIRSKIGSVDVIVALPDSTRFVFMGISGEHCSIKNISLNEVPLVSGSEPIKRIAPEVNYFTRKDGDIPNVEVDGYREKSSLGVPVEDSMKVQFRTMSLPVANLVAHCAYVLLFSSDDGTVEGKNYQEFACIRLDGDDATYEPKAETKLKVRKNSAFAGWDAWKETNKKGLDYEVVFRRKKNKIVFTTENAGLEIECNTVVPIGTEHVYVALTGDLCSLMNIRIRK